MTKNGYLTSHFVRGLIVQLAQSHRPATFLLCSNVDTIVLVSLNRYDRKQLLSLLLLGGPACECNCDVLAPLEHQLDTGSRGSHSVAVSGPAKPKHEVLCASWHRMHFHDKLCLLHTALLFWPIRLVRTQNDTFWKYVIVLHPWNRSVYCLNSLTTSQ